MREVLARIVRPGRIIAVILVLIAVVVVLGFGSNFVYFLEPVEEQEIGIQFQQRRISNIVGPGIYSDFGIYVDIQTISTQAITFSVTDPEIITRDKQRIGLTVSGDVFRPQDFDTIRNNWAEYRGFYINDDAARARVQDLAQQSMKVCVGDRNFDESVIGTARDDLRQCIDLELNELVSEYGIRVRNLVVPEVILSPAVQTALDAIVQSRLETEKAAQDELKANAEAAAEQARQEGQIRAEQSRLQEQARQQTLLAELERERLAAQLVVIEANRANDLAALESERQLIQSQKANDLLAAERDLEINEALAAAAVSRAAADLAFQVALADLYAANPEYVQLLIVQANASALSASDKIIFTVEGMTPTLVLPGPGIVPTVDTTPDGSSSTITPPAVDGGGGETP